MSFFRWLKDAFAGTAPLHDVDEPELPPEEAFLRNLLQRLVEPGEDAQKIGVGDREFWAAIQRLLTTGRERTAIDLLARFVAARPDEHAVTMRLAEVLCDRLEHATARPLLEKLTAVPAHALRAQFLLADAAERAGDDAEARRRLEAILAVDLDYPQARARADRFAHAAPPPPAMPMAPAPTLGGLPDGGADFAGRWTLLRELGRGASGAVYVARDRELERDVALKILHPRARERGVAGARAWLEARVAAAIRHPGVVAVYDLDEERRIVAMELCAGGALAARLRKGPLPVAEALSRAREIFATLSAVHARGVVHGDVKPANLLFRDAGDDADLVLGDFGLAQLTTGDGDAANDRAARGTLAYMSPEQRRAVLSPAADVYAAGVITVELLSGTAALAPWLGDRAALLRGSARWSGTLPPAVASALGSDGNARLIALVTRLLADDPAARPSAADAASAVAALVT
jgi:hypothetical protein